MNRALALLIAAPLLLAAGCADTREIKNYKFVDSVRQADFDYQSIGQIDRLPTPYPPGSQFQVGEIPITGGRFTLYKFQAVYRGRSAGAGEQRFHDILVVKLDQQRTVVDAFHYTLEWTDSPSLALFQAKRTGFTLGNGATLDQFGFANPQRRFNERGKLVLYAENEATIFLDRLKGLVGSDNKEALAKLTFYPLELNRGKKRVFIRDRRIFLKRYREIFAPQVKKAVLDQRPEDIYSDQRGYMIGGGKLWFDDWGQGLRITTINR